MISPRGSGGYTYFAREIKIRQKMSTKSGAILSASLARRDIQPTRIGSDGNWKPAKMRPKEMNFAAQ
jgi:hypothetical protein